MRKAHKFISNLCAFLWSSYEALFLLVIFSIFDPEIWTDLIR